MKTLKVLPVLTLTAAFLGVSLGAASSAWAHGDEAHAKPAGPVKKEQKPWGVAGDAKSAKRTITVTMTDNMRFSPERIDVKQGETVKIVVVNKGAILHEFVMGTKINLDAHAAMMMKFPTMEHEEPYMAHVKAGQSAEIVWTFNRSGDFDFACLIAGHYQAGMVGKISVAAAPR
ncbi:cupredoxin family protein [Polaromonas sp. SM01]|uniref:cupredoxin domain-containing protein n=1 Tax=Polaromonas sp. SM01 TaxID=3085630 RepID=UPI0029829A08|nr:cupredoxin family protein [Polaromonas sp. SM01]MDW5443502.1 cupredoxin family protein [Polaromonas sp. SM01]